MKHYTLSMRLLGEDWGVKDKQTIEFMPHDCMNCGVVVKKAAPNKRLIFCTFNALVDTCIEALYEDEINQWEIKGTELDTETGRMRYINFWGIKDADGVRTFIVPADSKAFIETLDTLVECGDKSDEYFDNWLYSGLSPFYKEGGDANA